MEERFKVKTEVFEGPLDLLLSLIEKRKLLINDISLSQVADDFIAFVESHQTFPKAIAAHFILIASTLLLIKSKSLLPTITLTEEETASIEDLETRLREYKRFKELSIKIGARFGKKMIFTKLPEKNIPITFSPSTEITMQSIFEGINRAIASLPKKESLPKVVVQKIISLEDMIERLTVRITDSFKMSFGEFAKSHGSKEFTGSRHKATKEERLNIIVSFLAMLELVKQGIIDVSQEDRNEDIHIETRAVNLPKYS